MRKRISVSDLMKYKSQGKKITALTAYSFYDAKIIDSTPLDMILVGDSLGMVFQGCSSTIPVTVDHIIYHSRIVVQSTSGPVIVADMPFGSFQISPEKAVENALRIVKESGCNAVKLEGGKNIIPAVEQIVGSGVPVYGHLGLTPQSINQFGSYALRAKHKEEAETLKEDALLLEKAGVSGIFLEKIPADLAGEVSRSLCVPTIGIGAGANCDGQVLVITDILGFDPELKFRFVRKYADLHSVIKNAVENYIKDVVSGTFPNDSESY
ncbi:MAG TPA: 3-methyl-2-oxobutanoate hydroxymethyltransferase [Clostridiales bacterium]|nr:3-methyl-2-oxobutanoate hydroxymethyltransferase [Clostridiales bacterium]HQP69597.1 3-methyl-2-oxobutanoate hydroxymethyltransferase [Clostridiales bacterium]